MTRTITLRRDSVTTAYVYSDSGDVIGATITMQIDDGHRSFPLVLAIDSKGVVTGRIG
jgi:hypothetical protein